jgi:hypothetical protein
VSVSREHEVDFVGKERTNRQALNILSACSYALSGFISRRYLFHMSRIQASQPKLPAAQYEDPPPFVTGVFAWTVALHNLKTSIHYNFFGG